MADIHVLVTMDFPPVSGGISNYLFNLWNFFNVPKSALIGCGDNRREKLDYPASYVRLPKGHKNWARYMRALWMVPVLLNHVRGRKVILHCGQVFSCGFGGMVLNLLLGTPYVVYVYGGEIYSAVQRPLRKMLLRWILHRAEAVVAISQYTKESLLHAGCSDEKLILVRPGVNPKPAPSVNSLGKWKAVLQPGKRKVILSVARLVNRKGHQYVLEALTKLIPEFPDLLYVVCGDGPCKSSLEKSVEIMHLQNHVLFCGHIPDMELPALYDLCDFFVLTPFEDRTTEEIEGFGIVYLEANAFGKAVIGSSSGGIPDAVEEGVNGFLVPPQNSEALSVAMRKLIRDESLCRQLGQQGEKRVKTMFQWALRARELEAGLSRHGLLN